LYTLLREARMGRRLAWVLWVLWGCGGAASDHKEGSPTELVCGGGSGPQAALSEGWCAMDLGDVSAAYASFQLAGGSAEARASLAASADLLGLTDEAGTLALGVLADAPEFSLSQAPLDAEALWRISARSSLVARDEAGYRHAMDALGAEAPVPWDRSGWTVDGVEAGSYARAAALALQAVEP
jgi:hypothetical protein